MKRPSQVYELGFEVLPEGHLLEQLVDLRGPFGVAYERCIGYEKDYHRHARVNLTFPRGSSRILFRTRGPTREFVVDDRQFLWMPAMVEHRQESVSVIYDNLALFPADDTLESALTRFARRYGRVAALPEATVCRRRSPLLDELLGAFFAGRILDRQRASVLKGLYMQILDELVRLLCAPKSPAIASPGAALGGLPADLDGTSVSRAVRFMECRLFEDLTIETITEAAGVSRASLHRQFQRALGMAPRAYLVRRRMDEARRLLESGDYKVSDVALLVGYKEAAAFTKAFRARFGAPPSAFRKQA